MYIYIGGGGRFEGWLLLDRIEVTLAPDTPQEHSEGAPEGGAGWDDDADVGCPREVGLEACRGCRVLGVAGGVVSMDCVAEGASARASPLPEGRGSVGGGERGGTSKTTVRDGDMLLLDDERRSFKFAQRAVAGVSFSFLFLCVVWRGMCFILMTNAAVSTFFRTRACAVFIFCVCAKGCCR
jgi:hypothetical protein